MKIAENKQILAESIEFAKKSTPIAAREIMLLAASKGQPASAIEEAIAAGIGCFGENRVQEAQEKWPEIKNRHPQVKLHLIGPLQTNKVKQALALFDVIQTLDRESLAEDCAKELKKWGNEEMKNKGSNNFPVPQFLNSSIPHFYIQVNTGEEPQKAGVAPEKADGFIDFCRKLELPVVGLMCVPPADQPPAPHFALLREIARRNGLAQLSMGMSNDFAVAARMGSTCVRIGTALFGQRE